MSLPGGTSAELRAFFLRWVLQPRAARLLREPSTRSVTLAVAQYWNDEARDAVHLLLLPSPLRDPGWPLVGPAPVRWPGEDSPLSLPYLDNSDYITAFGAYCLPGCDQEMSLNEAYRPYAIARMGPEGVEIERVGALRQPELEDRFVRPRRAPPGEAPRLPAPRVERLLEGRTIATEELLDSWQGYVDLAEGEGLSFRLFEALEKGSGVRAARHALEDWMRARKVMP